MDWGVIATAAATVLTTIAAGIITVLAGRKKASAEVQNVILEGFNKLVENLRDQIEFQTKRINQYEDDVQELQKNLVACALRTRQLEKYIHSKGHDVPV